MTRFETSRADLASAVAVPKLALHINPLMAAPPAFMRALMAEKKIDLSGLFTEHGLYRSFPPSDFVKIQTALADLVQNPMDWHRLFTVLAEESAAEGVVYAEFAVQASLCGADPAAFVDVVAALSEAVKIAKTATGVEMRLNAAVLREDGPELAKRAALAAQEAAGAMMGGFVVTGDERVLPHAAFDWSVAAAREAGLAIGIEAGHRAGAISVKEAVQIFSPQRLLFSHRVIEDLALVEHLAERETHVVLAPAQNIAQAGYADLRDHPISELDRRGLSLSVTAFAAPFWGRRLAQEYVELHRIFDWDEGQFRRLAQAALDAAFCDADTKAVIAKKLEP